MATYELTIRAEFSAAHRLRLYEGELEPLHGHNWEVEVYLSGSHLDEIEVVADFCVLRQHVQKIVSGLHDSYLNEHTAFHGINPTTERVARHIGEQILRILPPIVSLTKVRVWETKDCAAAYIP